jgi:hypothetical protein
MDNTTFNSIVGSITTMSRAQQDVLRAALHISGESAKIDERTEENNHSRMRMSWREDHDNGINVRINTEYHNTPKISRDHSSWLARFIDTHIIAEPSPAIAACEYCGRRTSNPNGCNNTGTELSLTCINANV